jgi:hypothetical protein
MKYALIIGNDSYNDPKLRKLKTPAADSRELAKVLGDKKIGSFDEVISLVNQTEPKISRAISTFFANKKSDDLVLVYFSGHGVVDSRGNLFLALKDTETSYLTSTAIPSSFIAYEMDSCRSKKQILILDCCNSGAFARGTKAGDQKVITKPTFEGKVGLGRVVLTASDSTQFAFEGDQVVTQTEFSLFTHFLLEGLKSGKADIDGDGYITLDEWYEYTYPRVVSATSKQIPQKWSYRQQGELIVAKNPNLKKKEVRNRDPEDKRTLEGLIRLKSELDKSIPTRTIDPTLLLATWNIREFGSTKTGGREVEPLYYIAEILSRFDVIVVQGVENNLDILDKLMYILGDWWKYVVSDATLDQQRTYRRHVFIYDTRKLILEDAINHSQLMSLIKVKKVDLGYAYLPYLADFRTGSFRFTLCAQNLYVNKNMLDDPQYRREAMVFVEFLEKRMKTQDAWAYNTILIGDFNLFSTKDQTLQVIEKGMFEIPANLKGKYTNAAKDKPFDQIAFLASSADRQIGLARAGTFPFFEHVYRDTDWKVYQPKMAKNKYKEWRTFKMSDHLPLWVELYVDFRTDDLMRKIKLTS